ncbi:transferrin-binding protein-like solute binding protein [Testudinibacter sp. P80/BLE/0925]|uniref:transferrin-binding protein-like solute binding protein n=1 Tax=Testudinibacter sp. TW-1 TaxID=3417757 RepID=UPI003D359B10
MKKNLFYLSNTVFISLFMAACSGGGGGSSSNANIDNSIPNNQTRLPTQTGGQYIFTDENDQTSFGNPNSNSLDSITVAGRTFDLALNGKSDGIWSIKSSNDIDDNYYCCNNLQYVRLASVDDSGKDVALHLYHGFVTPIGNMPSGTATYQGEAIYLPSTEIADNSYIIDKGYNEVLGNANISVDFGAKTLSGRLLSGTQRQYDWVHEFDSSGTIIKEGNKITEVNPGDANYVTPIEIVNGKINGNQFTATALAATEKESANVSGHFFGPQAEELGAMMDSGNNDDNWGGMFAGKK